MSFLEAYTLVLEVVSPIHVGTGETHPAYAYVIDQKTKEAIIFDPARLIEELSPKHRELYINAVASGPKKAQETLSQLLEWGVKPAEERRVPASSAFINTVNNAAGEADVDFRPLPRSPLGTYLPGSSVKGALRTAWLFMRAEPMLVDHDIVWPKGSRDWHLRLTGVEAGQGLIRLGEPSRMVIATKLEALLLDAQKASQDLDPTKDPFRAIRIADSWPVDAMLLNRIGVFHPKNKLENIPVLAETFRKKAVIRLTLNFHWGLAGLPGIKKQISHAIPPIQLAAACREFYGYLASDEEEIARKQGLTAATQTYQEISDRLAADEQLFPIRLGFGSGQQSQTLADSMGASPPLTRKTVGNSDPKLGLPLGWALARLEPV